MHQGISRGKQHTRRKISRDDGRRNRMHDPEERHVSQESEETDMQSEEGNLSVTGGEIV